MRSERCSLRGFGLNVASKSFAGNALNASEQPFFVADNQACEGFAVRWQQARLLETASFAATFVCKTGYKPYRERVDANMSICFTSQPVLLSPSSVGMLCYRTPGTDPTAP